MDEEKHSFFYYLREKTSLRFKIGLICLVTNPIVGWLIAPAVGTILGQYTSLKTAATIGVLIYFSSWILFGLGVLLSGREGLAISKLVFKKVWHRFFRK